MLRCHIYAPQQPSQTPNHSFASDPVENSATSMSVGKNTSPSRREADKVEEVVEGGQDGGGGAVVQQKAESSGGKKQAADQRRYSRCFSGLEISIGPGPLKDVDAGKLKGQIRKWARAVVTYARQLSFGSPRSSPRMSGDGATPRSATFPSKSRSKSGLGSARGDDPRRAQPPP